MKLTDFQRAIAAETQAVGTIQNDDEGIIPVVSVDDVTIKERNPGNNNKAQFTVSLSEASNQTVKVDYQTADSTAIVGSDYRKKTGTLTFKPGETSKTLNVVVLGDREVENDEFFWLGIANPTNATIEDNWGLGTIADND